jgi:serine/threonine-protein kinase
MQDERRTAPGVRRDFDPDGTAPPYDSAQLIDDLAVAVLDGTSVDWNAVESSADGNARVAIHALKIVATMAEAQREALPPPSTAESENGERTAGPEYWGHLSLIEHIGAGSFGEVYRAWDSRLDREVALKLLPAAERPDAESSVIREGQLLARVRHPNVVTIYGAEQIDDRVGLWMELVRGRTLEELLKSGTTFTTDEVIRIGIELSRAVAAVHGAGLLHRDIKAQNVMREESGRIVLMDFGTGQELTHPAPNVAGTPLYLAPEVLAGERASVQSDLYSLGVLLFRLLSGEYPVAGSTADEVRVAHERGQRSRLREVRPRLSRRLAQVVDRATEPRREMRYSAATALAAALEPLSRESRRLRRTYGLVAVGVAVLVGLSWQVSRQHLDAGVGRASLSGFPLGPATTPWWTAPRSTNSPVLAVLPIRRAPTTEGGDALADGLTYELRDRLATVQGMDVVASASAFAFTQTTAGIGEVTDHLGADFVVTGELQELQNAFRITVNLIRTTDSVPLWTQEFDTQRDRLASLPDDIARAIVSRLKLAPGRDQGRSTVSPEAYLQYLTARGIAARSFKRYDEVASLLESALAMDPSFARGWAALSGALGWTVRLRAPGEAMAGIEPRLRRAALEAIRLDPDLAEAHAAIGGLQALDGEWKEAETSFARAIELNPTATETHTDAALLLLYPLGRFDHAFELLKLAREMNPLGLHVHRSLACLQVESSRVDLYDEAIRTSRWALERDPELGWTDVCLGRALLLTGRVDEAERIFNAKPQYWQFRGYLAAVRGLHDEARAIAEAHPEAPARQMLIYAGLGDLDRAFDVLNTVADVNRWRAATFMQWPEMAVMRKDPRYAEMRRRLGVPE